MEKLKFNRNEIDQIITLYFQEQKSSIDIAKIMNCCHSTVIRILKREGLQPRKKSKHSNMKYTINEKYFSLIDTNDKAYFLGLLYADGTLNLKNKLVSISLQEKDKYILEYMLKYTHFSGSLKMLEPRKETHSATAYIHIYNENFYLNAVKSGLLPNKSLILTFPGLEILPEQLISHFIRGYFDGDGCAFYDIERNKKRISFVGTYEFLYEVRNILVNNLKIKMTALSRKSKNTNNFNYSISGQNDVKKVVEFLYKNKDDLYLTRKYIKLKHNEL